MIAVILVGIGDWERYTKPAVESIMKHEPDYRHAKRNGRYQLFVMDNGNQYPSMHGKQKPTTELYSAVSFLASKEIISYARAINYAIDRAAKSDYYIILNNDITCNGPFLHLAEMQSKDILGANTINVRGNYGWIDGWHYCIPRKVWERVGPFDEAFQAAAFEDADYTIRAAKMGIDVVQTNHPFTHLWTHNRYKVDRFWQAREENKRLLMRKHPEYKAVFRDYD